MCFFFLTIGMSVILALDVDGECDQMLPVHLKQSSMLLQIRYLSMLVRLILMPIGYGIDLRERNGCAFSYIGIMFAPIFAFCVLGVALWARKQRQQLNTYHGVAEPPPDLLRFF